jgi:hypothetical protein
MNSFRNTKRTAWFTSNTSNDAKHAAYIAVLPKKEYFTFSNDEILVLFRRLLYMDNHLHVNGITKCCANPKHTKCDPQGTQMYVCNKDGFKTLTHNVLNSTIQNFLSVAGINSRNEVQAFTDNDKRLDFIAYNFPYSTNSGRLKLPIQPDAADGRISKLATDISIVHPFPGPNSEKNTISFTDAKLNMRAANIASIKKKRKYEDICEQNGFKFLPLIFESTGKMHTDTNTFFAIVMNTINGDYNPITASINTFYWSARISCCLQKSIANHMLQKYKQSHGKAVRGLHFSHTHRANTIDNDLTQLCGDDSPVSLNVE